MSTQDSAWGERARQTAGTITTDDGVLLAYSMDGPAAAPPLLFVNSLGTDLNMWQPQVERLADSFRVIRYDTRGHGRSEAPPGPYTLERLGRDAVAVLDALSIEQAHLCGLSLGGLTGLWLAVHRPQRLSSVVLANTAARIGTFESWTERIEAVRAGGIEAVRETVVARFFSPRFRLANPAVVRAVEQMLVTTSPAGYMGACSALREADLRPLLSSISVPSLIIAGTLDRSTPPTQAEELHSAIADSQLLTLDGAAHLPNLEMPDAFNAALRHFLDATA